MSKEGISFVCGERKRKGQYGKLYNEVNKEIEKEKEI